MCSHKIITWNMSCLVLSGLVCSGLVLSCLTTMTAKQALYIGGSSTIINDENTITTIIQRVPLFHDIVKACRLFPHDCPFVRGSHQWEVDSTDKYQLVRNFEDFFAVHLNNLHNEQSGFRWFETPWRSGDVLRVLRYLHINISYNWQKLKVNQPWELSKSHVIF